MAFTQIDASVSRLAISNYEAICGVFKREFGAKVVATSEVGVGALMNAVLEAAMPNAQTRVIEDPIGPGGDEVENPAHSEIRTRSTGDGGKLPLSRKASSNILKVAKTRGLGDGGPP